jgi:hypothetical protein
MQQCTGATRQRAGRWCRRYARICSSLWRLPSELLLEAQHDGPPPDFVVWGDAGCRRPDGRSELGSGVIPGFDTAAVMVDGVGDTVAAWTFVRRLARGWSKPLTDDDGVSDAEVDAAQQSLGVVLPAALEETYRLLGRRPDLPSNQDVLLAPGQCRWDKVGEVLVFREYPHRPAPAAPITLADRTANAPPQSTYKKLDGNRR